MLCNDKKNNRKYHEAHSAGQLYCGTVIEVLKLTGVQEVING